jgi:hypothetical protein
MSSGDIPELGITAERAEELLQLNETLLVSCVYLWDYIIGLEQLEGVIEREKLALMAATARVTIQRDILSRKQRPIGVLLRGLS